MSSKIRKGDVEYGVDQDMTPMIDIVFLLIIFFMVVTELTLDQADVVLPVASEAKVVEPQPGDRVITINVSFGDDGREVMQIGVGEPLSTEQLIDELKKEAVQYDKWEPNKNNPGQNDSLLQVLIRCDQGAKSGYFHEIFKACQQAKIFKVRIGAMNERLEPAYENP